MNRLKSANFEDSLQAKIVNTTINNENENSRIFYFGQVVINDDPKNINRIKVRIPVIDEVVYVNTKSKEEGDAKLSWCLPVSSRFIDVPEINSIVVVAILDPKTPYFGRLYFDTITDFTEEDIFKKLIPEKKILSNFNSAEQAFGIKLGNIPKDNSFNSKEKIKYPVGLRGRGKNKFILDEDSTTWIQNEGDKKTESYMKMGKDLMQLQGADKINILSTKGYNTHYNPLFHKPMYEYLTDINRMLQKIIILLNTTPALSKTGPCLPSPTAPKLNIELKILSNKLSQLKKNGHSEKIEIN